MKKICLGVDICVLCVAGALCGVLLTGCGHNTAVYGDGIGLETTMNPETFTFGVNFRYGKILTACLRENSKVWMKGEGKGGGTSGSDKTVDTSASSASEFKLEVGPQITGYYVDAIEAGATPEQIKNYVGDITKGDSSSVAKTDSGIASDLSK